MGKKGRREWSNFALGGSKNRNTNDLIAISRLLLYRYESENDLHASHQTWPSACPLFRRALAPYNFLKEIQHHEETEGFFTYRIADRRGDHSDHRGHRHSELDAVAYGRERGFGSGFSPHD